MGKDDDYQRPRFTSKWGGLPDRNAPEWWNRPGPRIMAALLGLGLLLVTCEAGDGSSASSQPRVRSSEQSAAGALPA